MNGVRWKPKHRARPRKPGHFIAAEGLIERLGHSGLQGYQILRLLNFLLLAPVLNRYHRLIPAGTTG